MTPEMFKNPVPQWAPGAAEYLESLICPTERITTVFEWGGGFSTPWLLRRLHADIGVVITVESSLEWLKRIWGMTKDYTNHFMLFAEAMSDRYVSASNMVESLPGYRIFIIDGYQRVRCLKFALDHMIKPHDILVLDDALDYTEGWKPPGVKVFSMPHPHIGKPVGHDKWGNHTFKVGDLHPDRKETWIWVAG